MKIMTKVSHGHNTYHELMIRGSGYPFEIQAKGCVPRTETCVSTRF